MFYLQYLVYKAPNIMRLYLDQIFHLRVANALRTEGHDVLRASDVGQAISDMFLKMKMKFL